MDTKKLKLLLLGTEMGLALSESLEENVIEDMIRKAAETQPYPSSEFSRRVANDLSIPFQGQLGDCYGLYEENNNYCNKCYEKNKCREKLMGSGIGSPVSVAVASFNIQEEVLTSIPETVIPASKKRLSEVERNIDFTRSTFYKWMKDTYPYLESSRGKQKSTYVSPVYKKPVMKVDKWSVQGCSIVCVLSDDEEGAKLGMTKSSEGWKYNLVNAEDLKDVVSAYLDLHDMSDEIQLFIEISNYKTNFIKYLKDTYNATTAFRKGYESVSDSSGRVIMSLERFSVIKLSAYYNLLNADDVQQFGFTFNSYGAGYPGRDYNELIEKTDQYMEFIGVEKIVNNG